MAKVAAVLRVTAVALVATAAMGTGWADVVKPAEVTGLLASKTATDVALSWSSVGTDVSGRPETVVGYRVYRGTDPAFVPDLAGGSNRIGSPAGSSFTDVGATLSGDNYHYLVTAVDAAGNESASKASRVTTPPTLTSTYSDTQIVLNWSGALPTDQIGSAVRAASSANAAANSRPFSPGRTVRGGGATLSRRRRSAPGPRCGSSAGSCRRRCPSSRTRR